MPAIETWHLCGAEQHATEASWQRDLASGAHAPTQIRELKREVYGMPIPPIDLEVQCAVAAARRVAEDLSRLERDFPNGFGPLAREVRSWRKS